MRVVSVALYKQLSSYDHDITLIGSCSMMNNSLFYITKLIGVCPNWLFGYAFEINLDQSGISPVLVSAVSFFDS